MDCDYFSLKNNLREVTHPKNNVLRMPETFLPVNFSPTWSPKKKDWEDFLGIGHRVG